MERMVKQVMNDATLRCETQICLPLSFTALVTDLTLLMWSKASSRVLPTTVAPLVQP